MGCHTPWWASFPLRVALGLFVSLLILTAALAFTAHDRLSAGQMGLIESAAETHAELLSNAVVPGLIFGDVAMLEELMVISASSEVFVAGELRDALDQILVRVGDPGAGSIDVLIEETITVDGRTLGTMTLGFTSTPLREQARRAVFELIAIAVVVIVVSLVGAMLLARWTTRRLDRLCDAGLRIQRGEFDFSTSVRGRDEISGLERIINYAASALEASRVAYERTVRDEARAHGRLRAMQIEVGAVLWEADARSGNWLFVVGDVQRVFGVSAKSAAKLRDTSGGSGCCNGDPAFGLCSISERLEGVVPEDREHVRKAWTDIVPASAVEYRWQPDPAVPRRWLRDQFSTIAQSVDEYTRFSEVFADRHRGERHPDAVEWLGHGQGAARAGVSMADESSVDAGAFREVVRGMTFDVTEAREAALQLAASERRLQRIVAHLSEGLFELDAEGRLRVCNPAFERMAGQRHEVLRGLPLIACIDPEDRSDVVAFLARLAQTPGRAEDCELRLATANDQSQSHSAERAAPQWVRMRGVSFRDDGHLRVIGTWVDISSRRKAEQQIRRLAFFDALTGLPNRSLLRDRVWQTIVQSRRHGAFSAVLFLDLDHFKDVNDMHGHAVGDRMLCNLADVLVGRVRRTDTVSRLGGDEFVVLLSDLGCEREQAAHHAERIAQDLLTAVNGAHLLAARRGDDGVSGGSFSETGGASNTAEGDPGTEVRLVPVDRPVPSINQSLSIGVAMFGPDDVSLGDDEVQAVDELFRRADLAMYKAKSAGRACVRHFDASLHAALTTRVELEHDLRAALDGEGGLALYFQKICSIEGRVSGAEALIRWNHPRRGLLSPAAFIPLAERSGLIVDLGFWVLDAAVEKLEAWARDPMCRNDYLSINVSAAQLRDDAFEARLRAHLDRGKFPSSHLRIELTESVFLDQSEIVISRMARIADLGVRWVLDDFGTGYSSLSYLTRLPLYGLKIDRSFVQQATRDYARASVVTTIVRLANALNLEVVAEGIEDRSELMFMAELGCRNFQGFLLGYPMEEAVWAEERRGCAPGGAAMDAVRHAVVNQGVDRKGGP